jgi:YVTN family beta-propeller protein
MSVGVRPADGKVTVVGTSALNHVRYVPNLKGRFVRVDLAIVDAALPDAARVVDLNPHLTYSDDEIAVQSDPATFSQALRDESVGDPRAILWSRGGDLGYVAGMGSNNVAVIDRNGARVGSPLVVGEGPTGLAIHGSRLYVMNKFEASVSVVNTETKKTVATVALYDPTPQAVKDGRKFQYDTHRTSALGQIACASCHVDSRIDRIAWDLGDPTGQMVPFGQNCNYDVVIKPQDECHDFHPMKGPMLTQTLQDIIGREPFHWRGDKFGIEDFNPAFTGLQGHEVQLTPEEMQQYREFLATIAIPPNPNRNPDNSLPTLLPLPGQYSSGEFVKDGGLARGTPMPPGDAQVGEESFRLDIQHGNGPGLTATCRMCHTFPLGSGADVRFVGDVDKFPLGEGVFEPMPVGEEGEHYLMTSTLSFAGEDRTFKVPQLRALYKRVGFERTQMRSLSGFGFFHDGGESLESFVSRFKNMTSDQQVANFIAFLMSFSGSDLPEGSLENLLEPPGPASQDTHASVGKQVTFHGAGDTDPGAIALLASWEALADAGKVGLVAKGLRSGVARGYTYVGGGVYQSDHVGELARGRDLRTQTSHGSEMTFLVVPYGSETRIGIDRDEDGILDGDDAVLTPHRVSVVRAPRAVPISPRLSSAAH